MRSRRVRCWSAAAVVPLLLILVAGCSAPGMGNRINGSGDTVLRQYDYSGFTAVRVDYTFAATVTRADTFHITVTADDNLVKYLRVELQGDTLHIGLDPSKDYGSTKLTAVVTMPSLRAIEIGGVSKADVEGFASQDPLDLGVSGASRMSLGGLRAGETTLDVSGASRLSGGLEAKEVRGAVSGAGKVSLDGSASQAQLEASGAGRLDLGGLTFQDADLRLSGGASGTVRVTGTLDVEASGGAHLDYYGSPTVGRQDLSGGASISPAGG